MAAHGHVHAVLVPLLLGVGCAHLPPPESVRDPGRRLYLGYQRDDVDCAGCHAPDARGHWYRGSSLIGLTQRKSDDEITAALREGATLFGFLRTMPAYRDKLDDQEIEQLLAYLSTL